MSDPVASPSAWRAWCYLVWLSFQRLARARLLVWLALGLLAFTIFLVALLHSGGRWSMSYRRFPNRAGPTYQEVLQHLEWLTAASFAPANSAGQWAAAGSFRAVLDHASGLFVFSNVVVTAITVKLSLFKPFTVWQTPLMATLSPRRTFLAKGPALTDKTIKLAFVPMLLTSPKCWMMPVNIINTLQ